MRRNQQKQKLVGKHCADFLHTSPLIPGTPGGPWKTNRIKLISTSQTKSLDVHRWQKRSPAPRTWSPLTPISPVVPGSPCSRRVTAGVKGQTQQFINTTAKTALIPTWLPLGPIGPIAPCATQEPDQLGTSRLFACVVKLIEGRFGAFTWSPLCPVWPFNPLAPVSPLSPLSPWE